MTTTKKIKITHSFSEKEIIEILRKELEKIGITNVYNGTVFLKTHYSTPYGEGYEYLDSIYFTEKEDEEDSK